jgi:hypothetical protein
MSYIPDRYGHSIGLATGPVWLLKQGRWGAIAVGVVPSLGMSIAGGVSVVRAAPERRRLWAARRAMRGYSPVVTEWKID